VVRDQDEVVIIARSGAMRVLAYGLHLGARLPAHATSTGRVLLAAEPRAVFNAWMKGRHLPRLTPQTVTQTREFRDTIAAVRRADYCLAVEEHEIGVHALAVPVRDMRGKTVAALNVVASPAKFSPEALQREMLPVLLDAARELRA